MIDTAVILAGGFGTRLSEETGLRPKPLVEIGGAPILWHIMKIYYHQGVKNFVICLGYKGYLIKEFFANYLLHRSDVTFDFSGDTIHYHNRRAEDWKVTLVDTGDSTMTGGRLKRVQPLLHNEHFHMTYGDGLANIDVERLVQHHVGANRKATVTSVRPPGRFGALDLDDEGSVKGFIGKPSGDGGYINGGFFILSPETLNEIDGDMTVWEGKPLETLAKSGQLAAYRHDGFWQPMDTLRDKNYLEDLWQSGQAPWKTWR